MVSDRGQLTELGFALVLEISLFLSSADDALEWLQEQIDFLNPSEKQLMIATDVVTRAEAAIIMVCFTNANHYVAAERCVCISHFFYNEMPKETHHLDHQ